MVVCTSTCDPQRHLLGSKGVSSGTCLVGDVDVVFQFVIDGDFIVIFALILPDCCLEIVITWILRNFWDGRARQNAVGDLDASRHPDAAAEHP